MSLAARIVPPRSLVGAWADIETDSTPVFRRWAWVGTWLAELPERIDRVGVELLDGQRTAGAGVLASVPGSGLWALHHTGDPELDVVFVEHNGLLLRRGVDRVAAYRALLARANDLGVHELRIDGTPDAAAVTAAAGQLHLRVACRSTKRSPRRSVRPGDTRQAILAGPGEGLRQLRRTFALYEGRGPVSLRRAETPAERRHVLDRLVTGSIEQRAARGSTSTFVNDFLVQFHARLVADRPEVVALDEVVCANDRIALLYGLVAGRTRYAYQSARRTERDNRLRPGLVAHVLAMEAMRPRVGAATYDFLAGSERYKTRLATSSTSMAWLVASYA